MPIVIDLDKIVSGQHRLAAVTSGANPEPPKPAKPKAQSTGEMALRNNDTAKEAADYINGGSWGFRAFAKDKQVPTGPGGWAGQARDNRWLILEQDRDSTPKS